MNNAFKIGGGADGAADHELLCDWPVLLPIILTLCLDLLMPGLSIKRLQVQSWGLGQELPLLLRSRG